LGFAVEGRLRSIAVCGFAVALFASGVHATSDAWQRRPRREVVVDDLHLQLNEARWLVNQMEHGSQYAMPDTMTPDLPEHGIERLNVDVSIRNDGDIPRIYDVDEFELEVDRKPVAPSVTLVPTMLLAPGQSLNTTVQFDVDTSREHRELSLVWARESRRAHLPVPHPPGHHEVGIIEPTLWPAAFAELPSGDADEGRNLYETRFGCAACHGDPASLGSNTVGPHLGAIAVEARSRPNVSTVEEYLYESIRDPNAVIAPECKDGRRCQEPSAMPDYQQLLTEQQMADLVAYLANLRG